MPLFAAARQLAGMDVTIAAKVTACALPARTIEIIYEAYSALRLRIPAGTLKSR